MNLKKRRKASKKKMKRSEFWTHVADLRRTLLSILFVVITGFVITFFFHRTLLNLLLAPLHQTSYIQLSPLEGFLVALRIAFWGSVTFTAPIWLFLLSRFVLPALYERERQALLVFLPLSFLFMGTGLVFAYKLSLPILVFFLDNFTIGLPFWALGSTVNFVLWILMAHALSFELFALLFMLVHFEIIKSKHLRRSRRYVIVALFVLAAIFTPPDVASQLLLFCPLYMLFESAMLYSRFKRT